MCIWMWKIRSLRGKGREDGRLRKRIFHVCRLQEMRWRKHDFKMLQMERYLNCGGQTMDRKSVEWELR